MVEKLVPFFFVSVSFFFLWSVVSQDCNGALYEMVDGIAYLILACSCNNIVGLVVEAATSQNVAFLNQVWAIEEAFLKI